MLRDLSIRSVAAVVATVLVVAVGAAVSEVAAPSPPPVGRTVTVAPAAVAPPTTMPALALIAVAVPPPPPEPVPAGMAPATAPPPAAMPAIAAPTPMPDTSLPERVDAAFADAVPPAWRVAIPATVRIIEGDTSWARGDLVIEIGETHAAGRWEHLRAVLAHEFGHLIAFEHGSGLYDGAPPADWPDPGYGHPAEAWADCVAQVFTGVADPSYGMPPCPSPTLDWTASWLATGPT
jgi:hypothetical protein